MTDDADRRAKAVVDAELWLCHDYITDADGEEWSVERVSRDELARQIAAAIRAAVAAQREKDAKIADRWVGERDIGNVQYCSDWVAQNIAHDIRESKE